MEGFKEKKAPLNYTALGLVVGGASALSSNLAGNARLGVASAIATAAGTAVGGWAGYMCSPVEGEIDMQSVTNTVMASSIAGGMVGWVGVAYQARTYGWESN